MTGDSFSGSFKALLLAILSLASAQAPDASGRSVTPPAEGSMGGLQAILNNTMSPAFGATIIIIITVIVSGSAYLCFLKAFILGPPGLAKDPLQILWEAETVQ
ncbi:hypothetical protein JZ751_013494, partial [Albula glossodonta]